MFIPHLLGKLNPQKLLKTAFSLHPASELIIFEAQRLTRRQVFENILALAGGLQSLGVHMGERVVSLLPACPESVYTLFLPETLGTVHVPLNPMFSERELVHILKDCGAAVVVTCQRLYGRDFPAMLERMLPELPDLRLVVVVNAAQADGPVFFGMEPLLARRKPLELPRLDGRAVAVITYTSGTTGLPKGVMHSLPRLFSLVGPGLDLRLARCMLLPFPLYQIGGMIGVVGPLISGGKIILMERFDPVRMLESIQNERVTQVAGSPTMFRLMLANPAISRFDLSSLRRVTYGSEPCSPELARAIYERFRCGLENIYATTESMIISWTRPRDDLETVAATVGKPVAGVRLRIVDDLRRPVKAGTPGEVAVKSSMMMLGYYNDPGLTAQVLDARVGYTRATSECWTRRVIYAWLTAKKMSSSGAGRRSSRRKWSNGWPPIRRSAGLPSWVSRMQ